MQEPQIFTFGPFTLDCSRRVLERAGQPVVLSSRGFDILRMLIEARDQVVTRAELLTKVWPGRVVEEHNLSVQMSKLRQALGDLGDNVITTIPGRGYQFVAPVEIMSVPHGQEASAKPIDDAPASLLPPPQPSPRSRAPAWWRRLIPAMTAVVLVTVLVMVGLQLRKPPPPPRLSIVVMPFHDLSDHAANQYLADAISDDVTTDLARLPGSVVIARETADAYAGQPVSAAVIGRTLHVRYLLEGSLRVEDTTLHINAQLIDTLSGGHLWAERFDIPRAGLADTRTLIVGRIAGALDLALDRAEAARAEAERAWDPDAIDLMFRARSRLDHDDTAAGFQMAEKLLKRAVALRPDFAEGQAMLGLTLLHKVRSTDDPDAQADHAAASDAVARALALAPDNPDALSALAEQQFAEGRLTEASDTAGMVLAANPNDVEARDVLATCAAAQGHLDIAADSLQQIMRLNPNGRRSRIRELRLGVFRLLQGHVGDAEDWLRQAIAGEPEPQAGAPDWGYQEEARLLLIATADLQGRFSEARARYTAYALIWPHRTTWRIMALSTRPMSALPGFGKMTQALQDAGMAEYADEHADDAVAADGTMLPDRSFVPTPRSLPGATTVDTADLNTLVQARQPAIILDLGPGIAVITGAAWEGQSKNDTDAKFVDTALSNRPDSGRDSLIVVMADGTYGSVSYDAALRLVLAGYKHVIWYRGGEEAWSAARLPHTDLRP